MVSIAVVTEWGDSTVDFSDVWDQIIQLFVEISYTSNNVLMLGTRP